MPSRPKLNRYLSLIAATVIGNASPVWGAEPICSAPLDPVAIARELDKLRPAAIGPDQRAAALQAVPRMGLVRKLSPSNARKLESLEDVLRVHDRQSVYTVVVGESPHTRVGLYANSVVMIALPALELLTAGEVQAMVAHEIGHEYVWDEYHAAKKRGDSSCMRQLELFCDAIAVITLHRAGLNLRNLSWGLAKIEKFNGQFGIAQDQSEYPSIGERLAFIRRVTAAW